MIWGSAPREPYNPARVSSNEIGAHATLMNGDLELAGSVFLNEVRNEQILCRDFTTFSSQNLNADTCIHGLELDGQWQISESWRLESGLAWTKSRFTRDSAAAAAQPGRWSPISCRVVF